MTSFPLFFFFFFLFRGFGKNYLVSRNGRKGDVRGEILFNDYGVRVVGGTRGGEISKRMNLLFFQEDQKKSSGKNTTWNTIYIFSLKRIPIQLDYTR